MDLSRSIRKPSPSPLLALALAACAAPRTSDSIASGPGPGSEVTSTEATAERSGEPIEWPWTDAFLERAALVAERVTITGPRGLLDHTVVQADSTNFDHETLTIPQGFRQITRLRPGHEGMGPIRAQIDELQIMALSEIVVLERPGPVPVEVEARGEVYWHEVASGREQRGERLVLEGTVDHSGDGRGSADGAASQGASAGESARASSGSN